MKGKITGAPENPIALSGCCYGNHLLYFYPEENICIEVLLFKRTKTYGTVGSLCHFQTD